MIRLQRITGFGTITRLIEREGGLARVETLRMAQNPLKTGPQAVSARRYPLYPSEMVLIARSTVEAMFQGIEKGNLMDISIDRARKLREIQG